MVSRRSGAACACVLAALLSVLTPDVVLNVRVHAAKTAMKAKAGMKRTGAHASMESGESEDLVDALQALAEDEDSDAAKAGTGAATTASASAS